MDLKRHEDAREAFRQALKWLDWAKMERDKRITIQKDIQKWLSLFEGGGTVKNGKIKISLEYIIFLKLLII